MQVGTRSWQASFCIPDANRTSGSFFSIACNRFDTDKNSRPDTPLMGSEKLAQK
jgi:hypothetical protein